MNPRSKDNFPARVEIIASIINIYFLSFNPNSFLISRSYGRMFMKFMRKKRAPISRRLLNLKVRPYSRNPGFKQFPTVASHPSTALWIHVNLLHLKACLHRSVFMIGAINFVY